MLWCRFNRWAGCEYLFKNTGLPFWVVRIWCTGKLLFSPALSLTKLMAIPYCSKFAASRGYNIIPTTRLQKYVKSIDLRSALEDNVAFKLSFGATFMLAAFAELDMYQT